MPFYKMINTNIFVTVIAQIFRSVVSQWRTCVFSYLASPGRFIIRPERRRVPCANFGKPLGNARRFSFASSAGGIIAASLGPSNQAAHGWLLLHDLYYPWVYLAVFYGLLTLLNRHCWPANWHFTWHFPPRAAWGSPAV